MGQFGRKTVEVTGSASGFASTEVYPAGVSGLLLGIDIRLDATDNNASAIVPYAVCDGDDLEDAPAQQFISFEAAPVTLTVGGSDTVADLKGSFDNPTTFYNGLRVGGDVTATGAYKLFITIHYEIRDR